MTETPAAVTSDPGATQGTAERLFRSYAPRVCRLARRLLGNDADAEDVTQDVFVQVLRKLPTFRGEAALPTWLYRIAVNAALACRRRRAAHTRHEAPGDPALSAADGRHLPPAGCRGKRPDDRALDRESHQVIEGAIAHLPDEYHDVYVLAEQEELSCPAIAKVLGLSTGAVKSRLHRARLWMRRALARYFGETAA